MNSLKKVSKSIKANISGIGGSSQKLFHEPDPVKADSNENDNQNEYAGEDSENYIGPLHSQDNHIFITVREPWKWIVEDVCTKNNGGLTTITPVEAAHDLPSGKLASMTTLVAARHPNNSRTSRRRNQKNNSAATETNCTLRVEIISNTKTRNDNFRPWVLKAFHCTSQAFDGLDDKDELARTLKRCRCEDMKISPPSQLINWDVTKVRYAKQRINFMARHEAVELLLQCPTWPNTNIFILFSLYHCLRVYMNLVHNLVCDHVNNRMSAKTWWETLYRVC